MMFTQPTLSLICVAAVLASVNMHQPAIGLNMHSAPGAHKRTVANTKLVKAILLQ
jgi:hypothetical protein